MGGRWLRAAGTTRFAYGWCASRLAVRHCEGDCTCAMIDRMMEYGSTEKRMWKEYLSPVSLDEAVTALNRFQNRARIVAGATDLMLELERGVRTGVDVLIDVTRVPGLDHIQRLDDGMLEIGPLVTHNACVASKLLVEQAWPLPRAC